MKKRGQAEGNGADTGLHQAVALSDGTRISRLSALSEVDQEKSLLVRTRASSSLRTGQKPGERLEACYTLWWTKECYSCCTLSKHYCQRRC